MASKNLVKAGELVYAKVEKINAELFTLTYGALVAQLIKDFEEVDEVNKQLEKMGYNIGLRLIDEFLSKSNTGSCSDFRETAETIAKVGFKMFLGITATVTGWNETATEFSLILDENPLNDFVELPESYRGLSYSNILCGVVRGALEMVHLRVDCINTRCTLRGDDVTELKITLKEVMKEEFHGDED